jgi:16S rRNA G966 N2-methylase RsmD
METQNLKSNLAKKLEIGGMEFNPLFDGLIPKITDEEYQRLKQDINENGVLVPIVVDENKGIIDGINRLTAASELGHKTVPFQIHPSLSKKEKMGLALRLNALRRQWSQQERVELAASLRKEGYSFRRIGETLSLNHETVRRHLLAIGDTEEFPETITGKDGVERPANGKRKPCIILKSSAEMKDAFKLFSNAKKVELPSKIMDYKGLSRQIKKNKNVGGKGDCKDIKIGQADLKLGFFEEKGEEIPSESVDLVITDPPYSEDALPLWQSLGQFAQRVLKPGGILLSYSGQMYIPQIHEMLGKYLQYFWTFAVKHSGGNTLVRNLQLQQTYKPVIAYCKPPLNVFWHPFLDMVSGGRSKDNHEWEQPVEEAYHFIKNMCPKDGVICDPMMGSGSCILAGLAAGMDAIGIDQDTSAYATAVERVEKVNEILRKKAA